MADTTHMLSPDTQAILLMCGSLRAENEETIPPLNLSEYNQLAQWLRGQGMRPGDLLDIGGMERLRQAADELQEVNRILKLLGRGGLLALQVESWTNQGMWLISRSDEAFPQRLKDRLKHRAPPILYGAGNPALLSYGGLAMVGSRNADATALELARNVAQRCVQDGVQVISGGAKGVDQVAMLAGLEAQGNVIGILADSLAKVSVSGQYRNALREERMALVSPYAPHVGFSVGNAMGRNKLIYALSDWAFVVSTEVGKGGTWAGATEALKQRWVPVFVPMGEDVPPGNQKLIEAGGLPLEPQILHNSAQSLTTILEQLQVGQTAEPSKPAELGLSDGSFTSGQSMTTPIAPPQTIDPDTFWNDTIWPLMARLVVQDNFLDKINLSNTLGIKTTQADDWLKRAVSEGKLKKETNPVRYVVPDGGQMLLLGQA